MIIFIIIIIIIIIILSRGRLNLGKRQDAEDPIEDVILPPWAATAEDFVRIHRDALESEYVSCHLHKWIDLIFGCSQQGVEAERAYNIFPHVSYYQQIDMDKLKNENPIRFQEAASMLDNFGQTPMQLFSSPHSQRKPLDAHPPLPLFSRRDWTTAVGCRHLGAGTSAANQSYSTQHLTFYKTNIHLNAPVLSLHTACTHGSLMALGLDRSLAVNPVKMPSHGKVTPMDIGVDAKLKNNACMVVGEPFSPQLAVRQTSLANDQLVAAMHYHPYMCLAGSWDNALKIVNTTTGTVELSIDSGHDVVSCVAVSKDDSLVVVGSLDNSVIIYHLDYTAGTPRLVERNTLFGHDGAVTSVAVNKEMGLLCSGSQDGTICLYSLANKTYLRTIVSAEVEQASKDTEGEKNAVIPEVSWCSVTNDGKVIWYSCSTFKFYVYTVLGKKLLVSEASSQLNTICLSKDQEYILAAGNKIPFLLLRVRDLVEITGPSTEHYGGEGAPAYFPDVPGMIPSPRTLRLSTDENFVFLGLENGDVYVIAAKQ